MVCEQFLVTVARSEHSFAQIPPKINSQGQVRALNHGERLFLLLTSEQKHAAQSLQPPVNAPLAAHQTLRLCPSVNLKPKVILALWHKYQEGQIQKNYEKHEN